MILVCHRSDDLENKVEKDTGVAYVCHRSDDLEMLGHRLISL